MELDPTTLEVTIPIVSVALAVALYCFVALCLNRIADELSVEKWWYAWVPVMNVYLACKIIGKRVLWTVLLFVPVVNIVVYVLVCLKFAKACGRGRLYGVVLIIPVVNLFAVWHLAFGARSLVAEGA